ncbi:OmpA family protein [Streptobacillus canis]|uniref:OmpA family protein n=1 Tax=Streptobacillus canis TaxID=2678686 RepID=UPI0012E2BFA4|nr:OmpA family protein [Streptobacillus canis]
MKKILYFYLFFSFFSFSNNEYEINELNKGLERAFQNIEVMKEVLTGLVNSESNQIIEINELKEKIENLNNQLKEYKEIQKKINNLENIIIQNLEKNKENIIKEKNKIEEESIFEKKYKTKILIIDGFGFKSAKLSYENKNKILDFFTKISNDKIEKIEILGYADNQGVEWYNQSISKIRAKFVYEFIIQNLKINKELISYEGRSTENIDISNLKNRRVEIKVFYI